MERHGVGDRAAFELLRRTARNWAGRSWPSPTTSSTAARWPRRGSAPPPPPFSSSAVVTAGWGVGARRVSARVWVQSVPRPGQPAAQLAVGQRGDAALLAATTRAPGAPRARARSGTSVASKRAITGSSGASRNAKADVDAASARRAARRGRRRAAGPRRPVSTMSAGVRSRAGWSCSRRRAPRGALGAEDVEDARRRAGRPARRRTAPRGRRGGPAGEPRHRAVERPKAATSRAMSSRPRRVRDATPWSAAAVSMSAGAGAAGAAKSRRSSSVWTIEPRVVAGSPAARRRSRPGSWSASRCGQAEHALEVEAVAARRVGLERGVARRGETGRGRRARGAARRARGGRAGSGVGAPRAASP